MSKSGPCHLQYLDGALHKFGLESGCCLLPTPDLVPAHLGSRQRLLNHLLGGLGSAAVRGEGARRLPTAVCTPWDGFARVLSAAAGCSLVLLAGGCSRGSLC